MIISELKLNPTNPRFIKDHRFASLKASLRDFPKMMELKPIIYDPLTMEVLAGNMRLRALTDLKYNELPESWVKSAADLTEEEKKRFIIVDNLSFGEWDFDLLANDWDAELLEEWGMDELPKEPIEGPLDPNEETQTNYKEQYGVIVICENEVKQEEVYNELSKKGYNCKIVVT